LIKQGVIGYNEIKQNMQRQYRQQLESKLAQEIGSECISLNSNRAEILTMEQAKRLMLIE